MSDSNAQITESARLHVEAITDDLFQRAKAGQLDLFYLHCVTTNCDGEFDVAVVSSFGGHVRCPICKAHIRFSLEGVHAYVSSD
jgi:hypothetical protein